MPRPAPWYRGAFVLVTVAKSHDAYQHPRVSVVKRYANENGVFVPGLPPADEYNNAAGRGQTLLSFEFQQNRNNSEADRENGEPWLRLDNDKVSSPAYGGHLDTRVRVEQWGIADELFPRLRSVDKALKMYRKRLDMLGAKPSQCDCTTLVQALRAVWKLPVLYVVYLGGSFGSGKHFARVDPDVNFPTAQAVEIELYRQEAH